MPAHKILMRALQSTVYCLCEPVQSACQCSWPTIALYPDPYTIPYIIISVIPHWSRL